MNSETTLRRALRTSLNRHWLARLVIAAWAGHIPVFAFLTPDSMAGQAMERAGLIAPWVMGLLFVLALFALIDGAFNGWCPSRYTEFLITHRHLGYMGMAITLVLLGSAIAHLSGHRVVLLSFLLPAFFAVAVTWADLYARHKEACQ